MINEILIGLSNLFGYGGFALLLFAFTVLIFAINNGLGFIATIISITLLVYSMYALDIGLAPLVNFNLAVGIFIVLGLLIGFFVYAAFVRD